MTGAERKRCNLGLRFLLVSCCRDHLLDFARSDRRTFVAEGQSGPAIILMRIYVAGGYRHRRCVLRRWIAPTLAAANQRTA